MNQTQKKAIVLSSGGLDSTTALAIARSENFECFTLSFFYGQRHHHELHAAERISKALGAAKHFVVNVDLGQIGGSALTDDIAVPKNRNTKEISTGIPLTYVPARNTIFLSYALAWAEVLGASDIFIGVNAIDYSGYPDCRPEYIFAFEKMANLALKATVEGRTTIHIRTPLLHMSKAVIIKAGMKLDVDYSITHSCYDPDDAGRACGSCDSCLLRKKGFDEAGVPDPTVYTVQ
ncbi:MAG: 7-cyano-7-deazaguanine synthase QueC [Desulfobacteraceae bacterium]|nr:7-cyano-7-deazaguanine synthase QueC [Desulfobacteraceae bacterium]MBC2756481.1 7-cyano-7-deazaguanine synthase QueC [Desulfobacteraceae bacterium]